jgi:integrase
MGGKLTVKAIEAMKAPGLYADGGCLYLRIGPGGARSWSFRAVIGGKRRELGLGPADCLSLAQARAKAAAFREVVKKGGDPDAPRRAERAARTAAREAEARAALTFMAAAERLHAHLVPGWKNAKHGQQWLSSVKVHAAPFGGKALDAVTREDVKAALEAIWTRKPATAVRVRQRLRAVFEWARGEGLFAGANPVDGLSTALPKIRSEPGHHAAMPWRDVPAFWTQLDAREGVSAACLQFLILTAARSGEARGARWDEIDLAGRVWNVPAARMKAGKAHRVPLSAEALDVLASVRGLDPALCFPAPRRGADGAGRVLADVTFAALCGRIGAEGHTTHGFRSSFRDWCSEAAKADPELAEAALAHSTGNAVTRAYARSDLFDRRRALMDSWSRFCAKKTGQVIALNRA